MTTLHGGLRIDREYLCTVVGSLCSVYSAFYCRIAEASPLGAGAEANADMTPIIIENFTKLCGGSLDAQGFVDALKAAGN